MPAQEQDKARRPTELVMTTFGERLKDARERAGFSQAELTRRSGIPKTMVSRYENDHILPSISTLEKLALALNVGQALLLGEGEIGRRFTDGLLERGIEIAGNEEAAQLATVVADMVEERDGRVGFLSTGHDPRIS